MALIINDLPDKAGYESDVGSNPGLGRSPGGGHGDYSSILAWRISWAQRPGGL